MKKAIRGWLTALLTGTGVVLPQQGAGAGDIVVYASDTSAIGSPPPLTTAMLDGNTSLNFGTNSYVLFQNVPTGIHTVEVFTAASGYLPRESPDTPNAVNNPNSEYGNPRSVQVTEGLGTQETFRFDPVLTASATIRDVWTMDRIQNATIDFSFEGSTGRVATCKYPATASYASNWTSTASGDFPANTILYLNDYDMEITCTGYQTYSESNIITGASAGDAFNLQEIFLTPIDNNTNRIDDIWEAIYFGIGSNVDCNADTDGDSICNLDEYIAGTDPTNTLSALKLSHSISNNTMELTWPAQPSRTYRIIGTTDLATGTWVQVAGPWEAASNQTDMSWVETNMHLSWQSSYRVEVVPCTWAGINQILIRTNDWPTGGGSGSSTNDPTIPPLP